MFFGDIIFTEQRADASDRIVVDERLVVLLLIIDQDFCDLVFGVQKELVPSPLEKLFEQSQIKVAEIDQFSKHIIFFHIHVESYVNQVAWIQ